MTGSDGRASTASYGSTASPASEAGPQPQGPPRRDVLFASGTVGAALIAGRFLGPAAALSEHQAAARSVNSARPAWLRRLETPPSQADWRALRRALSTHKLIRPGQSGYAFAKELFSPQFDSLRPIGIAYCRKNSDVAACVNFASKFALPVRARSGGHSYGGWSSVTDGLIIDVSEMNWMKFGRNTVTVGTGIDLMNFYSGLAARGKAVPGGSCPTVGIAGLTLGGGVGVLSRIYGLTSDNLQSLDIITADGSTLTCNPRSHRGLYWASRGGGGGNFGVATSFTFRTHNLTSLVLFDLRWPWSQARRVVHAWQSWAPHEPDALWSNLHLSAAFGGPPFVRVGGSFVGSVAAARRQLDKLYHLVGTGPTRSSVAEHSYLGAMLVEAGCASASGCDTPPRGNLPRVPFFAKSDFFTKPLDSAGISALLGGIERLQHIRGAAGGAGSIAFDALGGAVNRMKPEATAFVHRTSLYLAQYYTSWNWPGSSRGVASQRAWIDSYHRAVHPHASGEAYQNYPDPSLTNFAKAYYGANYLRLSGVKAQYDPKQLFKFPQAIRPR